MSSAQQLTFPFPSLDFEGWTVLTVDQIAAKLRYGKQHIWHLIEQGELAAIEGKGKESRRSTARIPIECYQQFILKRMTAPVHPHARRELLSALPITLRREIAREAAAGLPPAQRRELIAELRTIHS